MTGPAAGRLAGRGPLLALCVAGAVVRFATIGQQSFWLDEAITGRLMRLGFASMLRAIPKSESTPPLYYVVAWVWSRAFGISEVGLRSLSALLGTLTIPLLYGAAARFFDRRAGLVAAALAAFAPLLIWYSQEARAYALLIALCAAGLWAFAAALESGAGRRALWLWAIAGGLAVTTHYFAIFLVGPELCWLVWKRGRGALPVLAIPVVVGLALAPLAIHQRANGSAGFIAQTPLGTRLAQAVKQLALGYDAPAETVLLTLGCLLGLGLLWLAVRPPGASGRPAALGLGGLALATVALPVLLALGGYDYLITRNLIVAWIPGAVALAGGLATDRRAGVPLIAGACLIGLAVTLGVDLNRHYQRDDWRGAAHAVPTRALSAVAATPSSGRLALEYYLPTAGLLPPAGATVSSIEIIALGTRGQGAAVAAPSLPQHPPTLAGFRDPISSSHATYTVVRYEASRGPVLVTPSTLILLDPSPTGATQLLVGRP